MNMMQKQWNERTYVEVVYQGAHIGLIELGCFSQRYMEELERTGDLELALGAHLFGAFVMKFGALLEPGWALYASDAGSKERVELDVERVHQGWSDTLARYPAHPAATWQHDDLAF